VKVCFIGAEEKELLCISVVHMSLTDCYGKLITSLLCCVAEVRDAFPDESVTSIRSYIRQKLCNAVKILKKSNEKVQ